MAPNIQLSKLSMPSFGKNQTLWERVCFDAVFLQHINIMENDMLQAEKQIANLWTLRK